MKTTITLSFGAILAAGSGIAQNVSYNVDGIPLPGVGTQNVVVSATSMLLNNTGAVNVAIGDLSMNMNVIGSANSAGGYAALYMNDGYLNTAFGAKALVQNTTGNNNSGFGVGAGNGNTVGTYNSAFGAYSNFSANNLTNASAIGANCIAMNSNEIWLGDAASTVWTTTSYNFSDARFKRNITENTVKGLDFINRLRPVTYNFDTKALTEFQTQNMSAEEKKRYLERDFSQSTNIVQTGFIAQEVAEAAKQSGYDFSGVRVPENEKSNIYGISYYQFVVPLVKAVQEQQKMIEEQKQANDRLQQIVEEQQKSINALLGKSGSTGVNQYNALASFNMGQNDPNPFSRETVVSYSIPEQVNSAYMAVYDLSGKQIAKFDIQKGSSSITFNSEKLSSGIYIYSIIADGKVMDSKKMIVADK